jgi:hypothetical protein
LLGLATNAKAGRESIHRKEETSVACGQPT